MKIRSVSPSFKVLSAILSVIILFYSIPATVWAFDDLSLASYTAIEEAEKADLSHSPYNGTIIEVKESRTLSDKTFRLSNGSFYAAHYNTNVHEEDAYGNLQDIDNRLNSKNGFYVTENGHKSLPVYPGDSVPVYSFSSETHSFSIIPEGRINPSAKGEVSEMKTELGDSATDLDRLITLDRVLSKVTYRDILPETDIEYVLYGSDVKENIILKSGSGRAVYSFIIVLDGLYAKLSDNGEVILNDTDGVFRYRIPSAVMWDADNAFSDKVETVFEDLGEGKYRITYIPDADWLSSADRQYPVVLDPSVYAHSSDVLDLYVSASSPTASFPADSSLYVSSTQRTYWKMTSLIPLPSHCHITGATITLNAFSDNTELHGYVGVCDVSSDWNSSLTWQSVSGGAAGVPADTFTDNRLVQTYDFDDDRYSLVSDELSWNVTPIVRKWYEGENYGLMFRPSYGSFTGTARFRSNDYNTSSVRPQLSISYVDMKGVEDYWTFSEQDAGFAGFGMVNNTTGNLVWTIPTLTSTDALMPVSPALVYNFCTDFADYCYPYVQSGNKYSLTAKGFKLNINETLIKKSFSGPDNTTADYFIWADGDGTEHYFLPESGNVYHDEDGLLLTLESSAGKYTVTDSSKTVKTYRSVASPAAGVYAYALESIQDKNGNKVIIELDTRANYQYRPLSVRLKPAGYSSEIIQLKLLYNAAGKLYCVYNPNSGDGVVFRYSGTYGGSIGTGYGNFLRQTVRAHGGTTDSAWLSFYNTNSNSDSGTITVDATAVYTYNYLGLLTKVTNTLTGYKVGYSTYASKRICSVYEQAGNENLPGQEFYYRYGTSSTHIQSSGTDDVFDTSDDVWTNLVFDTSGRCVHSYSTDYNGTVIYGASAGQYMGDENPKAKNNVKTSVVSTQHSSNYLLNGGFEQGSDIPYWTSSGNVGRGYSDNPINKSVLTLLLDRSVSLSSVYQYVDLKRNDYTLSADFLNVDIPEGVTVWLKAESVQNSAHSVTKTIPVNRSYESEGFYSESLRFSAEPSAAGGTERFKISITLSGHVSEATALSVDNVMLSCTRGAGEYDLVSAGHFEDTFGISPESFWELPYISGNAVTVDSGNPLFGKVLKMDYSPEEVSVVSQKIYQAPEYLRDNFDRGEYSEFTPVLLTYSGWAKGTGQSYSDDAFFCIDLEIRYYIGNGRYSTKTVSADFDRGITDWQFVSDAFMSDRNDRIIDSVTVLLYYTGHDGVGYFDDITVTVDSSNAVVNCYNNSGYLTSSRSGKGGIFFQYNANNEIVKTIDTAGRTIVDYEYDSAGRIYKQTQSKYTGNDPSANIIGISRTRYTYNTTGLITEILVQDSENTSLQTQTSVEYYESDAEHIYGAIKKETDVLGNETKYFRNPQNGRTEAVIGPNGKGTTYTYDGMGRTETVLPATYNGTAYTGVSGSSKVQYGYDSAGRLSTITTRETAELGTTYNFSYDVFGNGTGVSIGTRELASYTYNTRNGKLNTLAYGNGLNVRYVYDEYERISEIRYRNGDSGNFTTRYRYTYDSSGNLYSIEDIANHEITVNDYDSFGTLRSTVTYSSTDYYNKYGGQYYYDDESRISEIQESFDYSVGSGYSQGGNSYLFRYTNEGSLDKYSIIDYNYSAVIKPQYDNLGRMNTRTVTAGTTNTAHHFYNSLSFGYVSTEEYCTGRINQFRSTVKVSPESAAVSDTTYRYTYDQNGNITEIRTAGNVIEYKYCYDELGQLIREDNRPLGKTYKYTYDLNGNRKKKETYDFTLGTPGELRDRVDYTYGDPAWHDLLTKIGTSTIVQYDTVGNPIRIGDSTLTWEGRALRTRYDGQYQYLSYRYNSDGIRVFKEEYAEEPGYTVRHEYTVSGSRIIKETVYYDGSEIYTLVFSYDENGAPIGYRFRKPNYPESVYDYYYYDKNLQGDIIAVYGSHGDLLVSYIYDAWGKSFAEYSNESEDEYYNNSGEYFNPFRYRGYYYDEETGLYYLNSRYYDPEVGRFISPDTTDVLTATLGALTDKNLYAYCDNNPVMREDKDGQFWNIVIGAAVGAVVGAVSSIVTQALAGELDFTSARSWARIGVSAAGGALSGALAATCIPVSGQMIANGLIGAVSSGVDTYLTADENTTVLDYVTNIAIGTGIGVVGGKIGGNGTGNIHLSASAGRAINRGWAAAKGVFKEGINTTMKEIGRAGKYYYSQVCKQSIQCGIAAIKPIIASNIPNFINITIGGLK